MHRNANTGREYTPDDLASITQAHATHPATGRYYILTGTRDDPRLIIVAPDGTEHGRYTFDDALFEMNNLPKE